MSSKLDRTAADVNPLTITNSIGSTQEIDFGDFSMMVMDFPATWTTCTLGVYGKSPVTGDYRPLYNSSGAVTLTATQNTLYTMSESIAPCRYLKLVSNEAGNNAISCSAIMKS